jgi:hypothetical protein
MTNSARLASTLSTAAALLAAPTLAGDGPRLHLRRTGTVTVPAALDRAFELFTPLGEKLWVAGWDPVFHHPADGAPRAGGVFTTAPGHGAETIWMVLDWLPEEHRVRYARVTPGSRTGTVEVSCAAADDGTTRVTVTYELTALTSEGDAELATWTEAWYADYLAGWQRQIEEHLGTARSR